MADGARVDLRQVSARLSLDQAGLRLDLMDKSFDIRTIKDLLSSLGSLIIVRISFDISIRPAVVSSPRS